LNHSKNGMLAWVVGLRGSCELAAYFYAAMTSKRMILVEPGSA
jgi:hypothetical protein